MMNIFHCDAVTHMVVPHCKHATLYGWVVFIEMLTPNHSRCPIIVQVLAIQIVVIISGSRHYIHQSVGYAHQFIALALHLARVGIAVIPAIHQHAIALHMGVALGMSERTPHNSLLTVAFNKADVVVGELTEFLHHFALGVGVFVGAYVHTLATEHRLLALKIFLVEVIHEGVSSRIEKVKMVHAILLAAQFRAILSECQRMSRSINLRNDFHTACLAKLLKLNKLFLRVMSVFSSQAGISVAL